jgi:hypothetical protein
LRSVGFVRQAGVFVEVDYVRREAEFSAHLPQRTKPLREGVQPTFPQAWR